ncbi:major tail protein V [Escherichia coli 3030-1]|nr:major tail protein V [Escherichia coli 3030-1]
MTAGRKLVQLFDSGEVCAFRIKYPNGTVDVFRGWLSSLGKTIASKDVMTRTVKISGVGRPYLAEEGTETVSVTGLTVAPASASVKVGATTTLTFTVNLTEPVTKRSVCIRQIHRLPR